jgi:hypothetical protein
MGLFDNLSGIVKQGAAQNIGKTVAGATQNAGQAAAGAVRSFGNKHETFTFNAVPAGVPELSTLPEAALTTPFQAAALTVIALCRYGEDPQGTIDMLNFLKGPQPLNPREVQFFKDRLAGKAYKPFSFFAGATPQNNYTPTQPYQITVSEDAHTYDNAGYARLQISSGGADSPRPITMRQKGDQWFLWEQFLLSDIREPVANDPWA